MLPLGGPPHQVAEGTTVRTVRGGVWWGGPGKHTLRWMLKATVHYGPQELRLQQKVPEARAVDGNIGPLDIFLRGCWGAFCRSLGFFVFLIIQKFIFHILFCHNAENRRGRKDPEKQLSACRKTHQAREKAIQRLQGVDTGPKGLGTEVILRG